MQRLQCSAFRRYGPLQPMASFQPTRWSLVLRAATVSEPAAQRALGELCEIYWPPLYAFLRRSGVDEHAALDLIQAFCAQLLERGGLYDADPRSGAFRNYLLGALRHFVANERRAATTMRRGGQVAHVSLTNAEAGYAAEPADGETPERVFERRWAMALLARAEARLRDEYVARGKGELFAALAPQLVAADGVRQAEIAEAIGSTEGALKVALHRLRVRMRELIRDEVRHTVEPSAAVDDELNVLFQALGR
jgi:RNA polymerase sigma factor (sigma-70 family)